MQIKTSGKLEAVAHIQHSGWTLTGVCGGKYGVTVTVAQADGVQLLCQCFLMVPG